MSSVPTMRCRYPDRFACFTWSPYVMSIVTYVSRARTLACSTCPVPLRVPRILDPVPQDTAGMLYMVLKCPGNVALCASLILIKDQSSAGRQSVWHGMFKRAACPSLTRRSRMQAWMMLSFTMFTSFTRPSLYSCPMNCMLMVEHCPSCAGMRHMGCGIASACTTQCQNLPWAV